MKIVDKATKSSGIGSLKKEKDTKLKKASEKKVRDQKIKIKDKDKDKDKEKKPTKKQLKE